MENKIELEKYKGKEDFSLYALLVFNEEVMKMNMGRVFIEDEAKELFQYMLEGNRSDEQTGYFKVFEKTKNLFIGYAALVLCGDGKAEIEYMLLPEFWGEGYGSEIVSFLISLASKIPSLRKLIAITNPENIRSIRILKKHGFSSIEIYRVEENNSLAERFEKNCC